MIQLLTVMAFIASFFSGSSREPAPTTPTTTTTTTVKARPVTTVAPVGTRPATLAEPKPGNITATLDGHEFDAGRMGSFRDELGFCYRTDANIHAVTNPDRVEDSTCPVPSND